MLLEERLVLEARADCGLGGEMLRPHLDRDVASEPRVMRSLDLAHAPRAERGRDLVGAKAGAGEAGHPGIHTG
jgi:hypothetical protein